MITADFWVFALTAILLNLTPGNDMLYVIARSSSQGVKAGIVSALGIMVGCMVHILAAVLGLSAVIAGSALAFDIIKYTGAAYLIYLGVKAILSRRKAITVNATTSQLSYRRLFWQGAFTNVLNPKVALFFLAFLPQFISIRDQVSPSLQILFLGTWFNVGGTLVNILVALLFGKAGEWINRSAKFVQWQERVTGIILISLGIKVALGSRN
jgi:threonine/homoserine/homoserine lactone efflux protein